MIRVGLHDDKISVEDLSTKNFHFDDLVDASRFINLCVSQGHLIWIKQED